MMRASSYDSGARPLSDVNYSSVNNNGFYPPAKKAGLSKWVKIGIPVAVIVIVAAVVGGVLGSRAAKNNDGKTSNNSNNNNDSGDHSNPSSEADAQSSILADLGRFATATDDYFLPVYPSTTNSAAFGPPTFIATEETTQRWPKDDFVVDNPSLDNLRPEHPRVIAPKYKWDALPDLIEKNPYFKGWHETIMANASYYSDLPVVVHVFDGGPSASGILDPAREVKQRVKHFAYAYRMTKETQWVDRLWRELQNAANNGTTPWGDAPDNWNTAHFLDTAELTAAFGIAYDWLYDIWDDGQKEAIRWSIVNLGLSYGLNIHRNGGAFWTSVNGNWNCVSNGGLVIGALAILEDDTSGVAAQLLPLAVQNAAQNCVNGPSPDGTWSETPNYWYFGVTGHAELTSALQTATGGGDFGLLTTNAGFELTSLYHMYVTGMTSLFDYGDHGPNKFSTTANALLFYGSAYNQPVYTLFQRDRFDAAEPWSMFWYDPSASGAFWTDLPLDHVFNDPSDSWASFRTSWTDNNGAYVAIKSSGLRQHQTHGDLDAGDFVIDALGERWAGELGSADYLGDGYFSSEAQDSVRWLWYRKMTEGQNTLSINGANQNVDAAPTIRAESSGTEQGSSTVLDINIDSTAFFVTDLSTAYFGANIKRGIRFINGRRQILLQDEIANVDATVQWRMHTNATIDLNGHSATLELNGKTLQVQILDTGDGVGEFQNLPPSRTGNAPTLAEGQEADQENRGVSVLAFDIGAGTHSVRVLFNPQWDGFNSFVTPEGVSLDNWGLDSHQ